MILNIVILSARGPPIYVRIVYMRLIQAYKDGLRAGRVNWQN